LLVPVIQMFPKMEQGISGQNMRITIFDLVSSVLLLHVTLI
jgi:hypothetical protein